MEGKMGLLKALGKTVGTAALVVTGSASAILKGVSDTVGFELGSEILDSAKNASFNGIKSMWDSEGAEKTTEKLDGISDVVSEGSRKSMASTARRMAEIAKANGDMEKYEHYMEQYERYK